MGVQGTGFFLGSREAILTFVNKNAAARNWRVERPRQFLSFERYWRGEKLACYMGVPATGLAMSGTELLSGEADA